MDQHTLELIVTVVVTVIGSNGLWAFIQSKSTAKSARDRMILGLGHAEIFRVAEKYLHRGGITMSELEDLEKYLFNLNRKQRGEMDMKVKTETIIRTIVLILALANNVLAIYGKEKIPITENEVYQLITQIITICTALWAWWKNNSFTLPAIKADEYMEKLRQQQ